MGGLIVVPGDGAHDQVDALPGIVINRIARDTIMVSRRAARRAHMNAITGIVGNNIAPAVTCARGRGETTDVIVVAVNDGDTITAIAERG